MPPKMPLYRFAAPRFSKLVAARHRLERIFYPAEQRTRSPPRLAPPMAIKKWPFFQSPQKNFSAIFTNQRLFKSFDGCGVFDNSPIPRRVNYYIKTILYLVESCRILLHSFGHQNNEATQMDKIPATGLMRLSQIIGDQKRGITPLVPVSRSTWWAGVKDGRFPRPVKFGERVTCWKAEDIRALIDRASKTGSAV